MYSFIETNLDQVFHNKFKNIVEKAEDDILLFANQTSRRLEDMDSDLEAERIVADFDNAISEIDLDVRLNDFAMEFKAELQGMLSRRFGYMENSRQIDEAIDVCN